MMFLSLPEKRYAALKDHMAQHGGQAAEIRLVLHRDVTDEALETAIDAFEKFFGREISNLNDP